MPAALKVFFGVVGRMCVGCRGRLACFVVHAQQQTIYIHFCLSSKKVTEYLVLLVCTMATFDCVHHHDGSDLIVNFPQVARQPRRHSSLSNSSTATDKAGSMKTRPKAKVKSVSFSRTSELTLFPCKSKEELQSSWYSEEEKTQLKRLLLRKAAQVTRMLQEGPAHLTEEELCETVGLENFLNPRLSRIAKLTKQRHSQTLVFAQGRCDPALLAKLSEQSSLRSRERAHQRALIQF